MNKLYYSTNHHQSKRKKEQLIEQATTRLRRKQLEEQVKQLMINNDQVYHYIMIQLQQLKSLPIKEQHYQMDFIEKSIHDLLLNHSEKSSSFIQSSFSKFSSYFQQEQPMMVVSPSTSTTFTLVDQPMEKNHYILDHQKGYQRRIRIKNHHLKKRRQQKKKNDLDDNDSIIVDLSSELSSMDDDDDDDDGEEGEDNGHSYWTKTDHLPYSLDFNHNNKNNNYYLPPSPPLSPIDDDDHSSTSSLSLSTSSFITNSIEGDDVDDDLSMDSFYADKKKINRLSQRTVLDDTLDFLDQFNNEQQNELKQHQQQLQSQHNGGSMMMEEVNDDGFDEQFFQDMAFLLDHPEICNRPLADITPLLEQHHLEQSHSSNSLSLVNDQQQQPFPTSKLGSIYHTSWQWCRFLSVLSAAYMVSLLKGPDDLN
ncbi:hypothetical protein BJ944DRAFT_274136 [Cunninghamella echinulata]|nr:hypothetical protein BJ944DRAFT_274136 [Cunninghamella echinulata]